MANVQELITKMMFSMQNQRTLSGDPMKSMRDLYCFFERDYDAIARQTGTNTGIVFADCLDAVGKLQRALRETAEQALEAQEREEKEAQEEAKKTQRKRRTVVTTTGRKKPGVGRRVVSKTATKVVRRKRKTK